MEEELKPILQEEIKVHSFGEKRHLLLLNETFISFNNIQITLDQLTDFKFGVNMVQFQAYPIGRKFYLSLKSLDNQIDLVFTCYFSISRNYFEKIYDLILETVWDKTAERLYAEKMKLLQSDTGFKVGNCFFKKDGVIIRQQNLISQNQKFIPWSDLAYKINYNRLSLYSKTNSQIWTNLFYTENWNVDILIEILDYLYKENGLTTLDII